MAGFSEFLQQSLLDHVLKTTPYSVPANIYVALYTAAPSDTGGGTEVTGGSYARKVHNTWNAGTAASPSVADNNGVITFATATASWGTVTHFSLFDAITGGNFLGWNALDASKTVDNGDTAEFADGELDVTLD